ncbi:MAG: mannitol dehydrogenase family protein [Pusillimonas sp.]
MMNRLSDATLGQLPLAVPRPNYDRGAIGMRIVHLGAGAFFRSHLAVYADELLNHGQLQWGVCAVSIRHPGIDQALAPQDGLYTVLSQDGRHAQPRVVGSLKQVLGLSGQRQQVSDALLDPQTAIVSLTITHRGYCYDPQSDCLDQAMPEIDADLRSPTTPHSAIGLLAWAIARRMQLNLKPFTLLSCDNIPANGKVLQRVLANYIEKAQSQLGAEGLLRHFMEQYACPCTLVDRLTPQVHESDRELTAQLLGLEDAAPVVTEPYALFVIQDWFCNDRPRWEDVGVIVTSHVAPYEQMRYRLLDAGYLALGLLGGLAGCPTLYQAMQRPEVTLFLVGLMSDAGQTLGRHAGFDWEDFQQQWLNRLANPSLRLSTALLLEEVSRVLPYAVLPVIQERLQKGLSIDRHARVVAAWLRYLMRAASSLTPCDDPGAKPLVEQIRSLGGESADPFVLAERVVSMPAVFGAKLADNLEFRRCVTQQLLDLLDAFPSATRLHTSD